MNSDQDKGIPEGVFPSTHWSQVVSACESNSADAMQGLEKLCQAYWYPLYAFARHQGNNPSEAEDLTQGFFAHLLETKLVGKADLNEGKFRTFLLACFRNYMAGEWTRAHAEKRGGATRKPALSLEDAERIFTREAASVSDPAMLYERGWAMTVLEQAINLLKEEFNQSDQEISWKKLSPLLEGTDPAITYTDLAADLGLSEAGVRTRVSRMRRRFRELLRSVIAHTVATPMETEEELQHFIRVLKREE